MHTYNIKCIKPRKASIYYIALLSASAVPSEEIATLNGTQGGIEILRCKCTCMYVYLNICMFLLIYVCINKACPDRLTRIEVTRIIGRVVYQADKKYLR